MEFSWQNTSDMSDYVVPQNQIIFYTIGEWALGYVVICKKAEIICSISIGKNRAEALAKLNSIWQWKERKEADKGSMADDLKQVIAHLNDPRQSHGLDLVLEDLEGTDFFKSVWRAVLEIPFGKTETYTELAIRMGLSAKTNRAVALAIAANRLAVVIPCHRVRRADGSLAGYRWGVDLKRALLEREQGLEPYKQPEWTLF